MMKSISSNLHKDISLIYPDTYYDDRGSFSEIWKIGELFKDFQQENMSKSKPGTFRGLHYQWDEPQGKLIRIIKGSAYFFELDIRRYSKNFGKIETFFLTELINCWLWVPPGFANGFYVPSDNSEDAIVLYKCTEKWSMNEGSIHHSCIDELIKNNINFDVKFISEKDAHAQMLNDIETLDHLDDIQTFFLA